MDERTRERNRLKSQRHRERVTRGVTEATSEGGYAEEGVTGEGVTESRGVTRLNPANGLAYGPSMASLPERVLAEYERKWKQYEPVYGEGVPGENMACIAVGFGSIFQALASKHLENEVRVGVYGPTVGDLYEATHP